ncbi:hypothetical protein OG539_16410 [Actinacidiphila glaucinigra]|uniref:hypothetical protein n=1 Tax=Actinacidiphila glaucinigra TaxID=235986 RepID=UPI003244F0CD
MSDFYIDRTIRVRASALNGTANVTVRLRNGADVVGTLTYGDYSLTVVDSGSKTWTIRMDDVIALGA